MGKILGIFLTGAPYEEVLKKIASDIKTERVVLITTPNPEIVLRAQEDSTLKKILNKADISIPDGVGLVAGIKFLSLPNPKDKFKRLLTLFVQALGVSFSIVFNRKWLFSDIAPIRGRDLAFDLVKLAHKANWRVFLLGGESGEAERATARLGRLLPGLKIASHGGPLLTNNLAHRGKADRLLEEEALEAIKKFAPEILMCAMTSPKQEKWLYRYLQKTNAKVGMGVGGTFKYFAGDYPLPPKWIDGLGLSWLFRLVTGDQDVERITDAVWKFPAKVFLEKFRAPANHL